MYELPEGKVCWEDFNPSSIPIFKCTLNVPSYLRRQPTEHTIRQVRPDGIILTAQLRPQRESTITSTSAESGDHPARQRRLGTQSGGTSRHDGGEGQPEAGGAPPSPLPDGDRTRCARVAIKAP